jgi:fatty-acid peroxygenase
VTRRSPDSSLALLRDPYRFIARRAGKLGEDVFETRVLLRRTICLVGREAGRLFYDDARLQRVGAAPGVLQKTLFGAGGVQGLDGDRHRHRKAMFLDVVDPEAVQALADEGQQAVA